MRSGYGVLMIGMMLLSLVACKEEQAVQHSDLIGMWVVTYAERDGKPTELINGAVFQIDDSTMSTDFTGFEKHGRYEFDGSVLRHSAQGESVYEVVSVRVDTMDLRTRVSGLRFDMELMRQNEN